MGAWIEIFDIIYHIVKFSVAPLVGAWIEITTAIEEKPTLESLPSWERGLKFVLPVKYEVNKIAARWPAKAVAQFFYFF